MVEAHHPEDEFIILEIEEGQVTFQDEQMAAEYQAALKRQRMRKLAAMSCKRGFCFSLRLAWNILFPKGWIISYLC